MAPSNYNHTPQADGTLRGSFTLRGNTLTLNSTELSRGESPEVDRRIETLTLTVNDDGDRITLNDNFAFNRSPYYFIEAGDVFIKSPGFN
ncbi:MAG: hypothetical protein FWC79_02470 [Oscillospiraceae bacterium]|nr:hypothetical protein [Oscillospiraceae bacterium]